MGKIAGIAVLAIVLVLLMGFLLPSVFSGNKTEYFGTSSLKNAVNIESLSTVEYPYTGIAEKHSTTFFGNDKVNYRVKYDATVRASYKLSSIEFVIDEKKRSR